MRKTFALLLAVWLASCTSNEKGEVASSSTSWSVGTTPLVEIATDDTLETIGNIAGVARMSDGRIAVADQSNSLIKVYDANGTFIRNVGRAGSGPGEFEMLGEMLHCGDSLYARDFSKGDFAVVTADGVFGRRAKIALPDSVRSSNRSVCNTHGQFITAGWDAEKQDTEKSGPSRGPVPFWISDASGAFMASAGSHLGPEKWLSILPEGMIIVGPRPLGKETQIAIGKTKAYIGTADSSVIRVYSLKGDTLPSIVTPFRSRRTTAADVKAFEVQDTIAIPPERRPIWVNQMRGMKYPDVLPAYSAIVVDSEDHVWIRAFPTASEKLTEWQVFSESGAAVASVRMPSTLRVTEIGRDYVAGIDSDPMTGRQQVKVLPLSRKEP